MVFCCFLLLYNQWPLSLPFLMSEMIRDLLHNVTRAYFVFWRIQFTKQLSIRCDNSNVFSLSQLHRAMDLLHDFLLFHYFSYSGFFGFLRFSFRSWQTNLLMFRFINFQWYLFMNFVAYGFSPSFFLGDGVTGKKNTFARAFVCHLNSNVSLTSLLSSILLWHRQSERDHKKTCQVSRCLCVMFSFCPRHVYISRNALLLFGKNEKVK